MDKITEQINKNSGDIQKDVENYLKLIADIISERKHPKESTIEMITKNLMDSLEDTLDFLESKDFSGYKSEMQWLLEFMLERLGRPRRGYHLNLSRQEFWEKENEIKRLIKLALRFSIKKEKIFNCLVEAMGFSIHAFDKINPNEFINYAVSEYPLLITGETGSGKELVARLIYYFSGRVDKPFKPLNCAGLPTTLIESELFGHAKGAFTGAIVDKVGFFESAKDGTIFLDEIGDMAIEAQAKLLRVLETGEFYPIGKSDPKYSKARVICATNQDISRLIEKGTFRNDLYYRISIHEIELLPLRTQLKRMSLHKMSSFFNFYIYKVAKNFDKGYALSDKAIKKLSNFSYPGNFRDLNRIIINLFTQAQDKRVVIDAKDIRFPSSPLNFNLKEDKFDISTMNLNELKKYTDGLFVEKLLNLAENYKGFMIDAAIEEGFCKNRNDKNGLNKFRKLCQKYNVNFKDYRINKI